MIRLGINTVGELIRRTGDDLLECKNFGVTSLNEVREKLAQQGLKLRGE
jgi:DNA-directed RNA polymerase subunit alpha